MNHNWVCIHMQGTIMLEGISMLQEGTFSQVAENEHRDMGEQRDKLGYPRASLHTHYTIMDLVASLLSSPPLSFTVVNFSSLVVLPMNTP